MLDEKLIIALGRVVLALTGAKEELEEYNKNLLAELVLKHLPSSWFASGKSELVERVKHRMFNSFPVDDWETEVKRTKRHLKNLQESRAGRLETGMLKVIEKTLQAFRSDLIVKDARQKLLKEVAARLF